jgi:hypothetical protein
MKALGAIACAAATLAFVEGSSAARAQSLDTVETAYTGWMAKHKIQRGVLTVTYQRRLVLTRGYGGTDANAVVRLASLSKAITAVCVATLVDAGKVRFDSRMGDVLATFFATNPPADPRVRDVTIAQALAHRTGYHRLGSIILNDPVSGSIYTERVRAGKVGDPAITELLSQALRTPPSYPPGDIYRYNNTGYAMLGAAIEAVSGQSYERTCNDAVLKPMGIPGATLDPIFTMSSSFGAWMLSGPQYLSFYEAFAPQSKVLAETAQSYMRDPADKWVTERKISYYTLGVNVSQAKDGTLDIWHGGTKHISVTTKTHGRLAANSKTLAMRMGKQGIAWFAQAEPGPPPAAMEELRLALNKAARAVKEWPANDLYMEIGKK